MVLKIQTDSRELWEKMVSRGDGFNASWDDSPWWAPLGEVSFHLPIHVVAALQPERTA